MSVRALSMAAVLTSEEADYELGINKWSMSTENEFFGQYDSGAV